MDCMTTQICSLVFFIPPRYVCPQFVSHKISSDKVYEIRHLWHHKRSGVNLPLTMIFQACYSKWVTSKILLCVTALSLIKVITGHEGSPDKHRFKHPTGLSSVFVRQEQSCVRKLNTENCRTYGT